MSLLRKKKFSGDLVSTEDFKNALHEYEKHKGFKYDICVFDDVLIFLENIPL